MSSSHCGRKSHGVMVNKSETSANPPEARHGRRKSMRNLSNKSASWQEGRPIDLYSLSVCTKIEQPSVPIMEDLTRCEGGDLGDMCPPTQHIQGEHHQRAQDSPTGQSETESPSLQIKEEPVTCEEGMSMCPASPCTPGEGLSVCIMEELASCEEGKLTYVHPPSDYAQTEDPSVCIKDEPYSCEEGNLPELCPPLEYTQTIGPYTQKEGGAGADCLPTFATYVSEGSFVLSDMEKFPKIVKCQETFPEETLYSCPECRKHFSKKVHLDSHLLLHLKRHTENTTSSCPTCGRRFSCKYVLANHQRSHGSGGYFPCDKCGKVFSCSSGLLRHEVTHTGKKPYSCSECGKGFLNKYSIVKHLRKHGEQNPDSPS